MGLKKQGVVWGMVFCAVAFSATDPEKVFKGKDRLKKPCELRVLKTYYKGTVKEWANLQVDVETGYGHDEHVPGPVTVAPLAKDAKFLEGTNSDGSKMKIGLGKEQDSDLASAEIYRLDWKHGDHFHVYVCSGLKAIAKP
jgi:hypothetical protein